MRVKFLRVLWGWVSGLVLVLVFGLSACGGGNSTSVTYSGGGVNSLGQSPAVSLAFTQVANNLPVTVESGIGSGPWSTINTNILYATVRVCDPANVNCVDVDHVQVDTGSVGLRIMASKLSALVLPDVTAPTTADSSVSQPIWECYQFVIGGLWGRMAAAKVQLGPQATPFAIPVQLIQDNSAGNVPQATANCSSNTQGGIMSSSGALGANGILGIGSVNIDCGGTCVSGNYGSVIQYYTCPAGAANSDGCTAARVSDNSQAQNPVYAMPSPYNNGFAISMPAVTGVGAVSATGELILGIDGASNNMVGTAQKVYLGTDPSLNNGNSYLSITTQYGGNTYYDSYLDTGSNGLFFEDANLATCNAGASFYCPSREVGKRALISDGLNFPPQLTLPIDFTVGNANVLLATANAAFGNLAGTAPVVSGASVVNTFDWGMPFFYGRKVFQSIWDLSSPTGPWYAWTSN